MEDIDSLNRAYPHHLAKRLRAMWPAWGAPLPTLLERVLDTAYHASFLRDEERPVTFRILMGAPSLIPDGNGPPHALLALPFREPRTFEEHELRRLSPAAKFQRSLVGVHEVEDRLLVWGLVQSGPRWLQNAHGGHAKEPATPPHLVVRAVRAGHLTASCGAALIAELRGGRLSDFALDVFASQWLPGLFAGERGNIISAHRARGGHASETEIREAVRTVAQQMVKRVIAIMRAAHHGGALVVIPQDCSADRFLTKKYAFGDDAGRRHFGRLVLEILAARSTSAAEDPLRDEKLAALDEALFELGHVIAGLADVDGAVVLTKNFEILGFGAEIAGDLPVVHEVKRALDVEGETTVNERVDDVGTRHRSAYRLCAAVPGALAIVVSQDGSVRFATKHRGSVTYWDHGLGD